MDLKIIRKNINKIDQKIIELLAKRFSYLPAVKEYKTKNNLPINQPKREKEMMVELSEVSISKGVDPKMIRKVFRLIIDESKKIQRKIK